MPTHSGKFVPKNPDKYRGDHSNIIYRSMWEKYCFIWADNSSNVEKWSSEEIVVPYVYDMDKRIHRYFTDMWIRFQDGTTLLVEVKPFKETQVPVYPGKKTPRFLNESLTYVKNQNKWKAATKYAEERGWKFVVWTENELQSLGIMPKMAQRMKPLRPAKGLKKLPPFKKKKPQKL